MHFSDLGRSTLNSSNSIKNDRSQPKAINQGSLEPRIAYTMLVALAWLVFWFGGVHMSQAWLAYGLLGVLGITVTYKRTSIASLLPNDSWTRYSMIGGVVYIIILGFTSSVKYHSHVQLANMVPVLLALMISIQIATAPKASTFILLGIITIGLFTSFYSIYQRLTDSSMVLWEIRPSVYDQRFGSIFINPNHHAALLICSLSLILSLIFIRPFKKLQRMLLALIPLCMIFALYISKSRGGWIGSMISILLLGYCLGDRFSIRTRMTIMLGIIIGIFAASYFYSSGFRERIEGTFTGNTGQSGLFRFWLWAPTVDMWLDQPLLGVGPGQFNVRFPAYRTAFTQLNPIHAHNEYLEALVEYGLIGFLLIFTFVARVFYQAIHFLKTNSNTASDSQPGYWHKRFVIIGSTAGLIGFAVHSFFEFNLRIPALAVTAAVLLGTLIGSLQHSRPINSGLGYNLRRLISSTVFAIGWMIILPTWFVFAREDRYINSAMHRGQDTPNLIRDLKSAASIMPHNPDTQFWIGEEIRRSLIEQNPSNPYQVSDALQWLNRSASLNPHNARTKMTIGRCLLMAKLTNEAVVMLKTAYDMSPNDTLTINPLAGAYLRLGNITEARKLVDQSLGINDWNNNEARFYHNILSDTKTNYPNQAPSSF